MTSERGSSLLLFPAGVLIVMVLAAMAVDTSIAFMGQRELANATAAAANDAASQAMNNAAFYQQDRIELDPVAVESLAVARVRAAVDQSRHGGLSVQAVASPPATAGCPWTVKVYRVIEGELRLRQGDPRRAARGRHPRHVGRRPRPSG